MRVVDDLDANFTPHDDSAPVVTVGDVRKLAAVLLANGKAPTFEDAVVLARSMFTLDKPSG